MAKQTNNVVTYGLRGKVGDLLVFRQRAGQTIVSKVPQKRKEDSEKQKEHQRKFQRAVLYAKAAMADSDTAETYNRAAKKGRTGYNVDVADFFNAPDIHNVNVSGYTGQPGDVILIQVNDDFKVKEVKVTITHADGSLVEEGNAVSDSIGYVWTFTATSTNDCLGNDRIEITVSDHPGNVTQDSVNI
jgi:signal peptidase I